MTSRARYDMVSGMIFDDLPDGFDQISTPVQPAKAGWTVSIEEVAAALKILRIEKKLTIIYQGKGIWRTGTHYITWEGEHRIVLNQNRDMPTANHSLWHELAHAMQAERWARETGNHIQAHYRDAYKKAAGPWGKTYELNELELEAEEIANENKGWWLVYGNYYD